MIKREDLLTKPVVKALTQHAVASYPNECIGAIVGGEYVRMDNVAGDKERHARAPREQMDALIHSGELEAICHSHPNGPNCPSLLDMKSQMSLAKPSVIIATDGSASLPPFAFGDQLEPYPLLDRPFRHGVTDCYELVRDEVFLRTGHRMPFVPRAWEWWNTQDLYVDWIERAGFRTLEDHEEKRVGDGIMFAIRSKNINHAAIYVGQGLMIHHAADRQPWQPNRPARREPLVRWKDYIRRWVRHEA